MKTHNEKAHCKNCPHWEDREILKPPAGDGYCMRFPPVLHSEYDGCDSAAWFWPITGTLGVCGEHPQFWLKKEKSKRKASS